MINRPRYGKHFGDSHWKTCKTTSFKSGNIAEMFAAMQAQAASAQDTITSSDVDWENKQATSDSEFSEYSFPCVALEDLDPVVIMLQREIEAKKLVCEECS